MAESRLDKELKEILNAAGSAGAPPSEGQSPAIEPKLSKAAGTVWWAFTGQRGYFSGWKPSTGNVGLPGPMPYRPDLAAEQQHILANILREIAQGLRLSNEPRHAVIERLDEIHRECVEHNRENGLLKSQLAELKQQLQELSEELRSRPAAKPGTITDLGTPELSLREPIQIVIEVYEDEVTASWPEVEAFGSGDSESEAILALKKDIVGLFRDLQSTQDAELGSLPLSWKSTFARLIEANGKS